MIEKNSKKVFSETSENDIEKINDSRFCYKRKIEQPSKRILRTEDVSERQFYPDSDRKTKAVPPFEKKIDKLTDCTSKKEEVTETEFYSDSERKLKNCNLNKLQNIENVTYEKEISPKGVEKQKDASIELNIEEFKDNKEQSDVKEKEMLSDEEKYEIKKEINWSNEIIESIKSIKEAKIYIDAGLIEDVVGGKKVLIRENIDLEQVDEDGISNRDRMERGRPPLTKDGQEIELHHIGQKKDSPLAELTTQEHRGVGNDRVLHDKNKESEIDRKEFAKERKNHWKSRIEEEGKICQK